MSIRDRPKKTVSNYIKYLNNFLAESYTPWELFEMFSHYLAIHNLSDVRENQNQFGELMWREDALTFYSGFHTWKQES